MEPQPFVSCVCVTGKEPERVKRFLPVAIKCFHQQDYPADRRELILVADGCFDLLPSRQGNLKVVAVQTKKSLGELRNIGLETACGHLVCQFDDDDWHRNDRISSQVEVWKHNPQAPVLLQYQLCYDFDSDTAAVRFFDNMGIHGTILHPKTDGRYPAQSKEEDSEFLKHWPGMAVMANDPAMYVRFTHAGSTWDAKHTLRHFGQPWAKGQWYLGDRHRAFLQNVLAEYGITHPRPTALVTTAVPELVEQ